MSFARLLLSSSTLARPIGERTTSFTTNQSASEPGGSTDLMPESWASQEEIDHLRQRATLLTWWRLQLGTSPYASAMS